MSLLEKFSEMCPAVRITDYLCFYALRTWDICNGRVVTEQIYVDNKVRVNTFYIRCDSKRKNVSSSL